ncbi:MAG: DUF3021 family protein [Eubacteriales bacterium]
MKAIRFLIRKIIYPTGLIYTALSMAILVIVNLVDSSKPALSISTAGMFLLLALLISVCNLIFSLRQFSMLTRVLLHYPAVLLSTALVMLFNANYDLTVNSLVLVLVFSVLYAIIVPAILLIGSKFHQTDAEEKTYESIFSPKN